MALKIYFLQLQQGIITVIFGFCDNFTFSVFINTPFKLSFIKSFALLYAS